MEDAAGKMRTLSESPALKFGERKPHHFNVSLPGNCGKVRLETGAADGSGDSHRVGWADAGFRKQ
jgi:hypothetical protein